MPTYDYQCESCGHRFEVFQRMSDPKLETCPVDECGGRVKRLPGTGAGLIFKGSGFYQTDYRSDSYRSAEKNESKPAATTTATAGKSGADGSGTAAATPAPGGCGSGCGCAAA